VPQTSPECWRATAAPSFVSPCYNTCRLGLRVSETFIRGINKDEIEEIRG